ncbi:MAG TPA: hypothetical protein VE570_14115 [Thermoleophilaceae bacterium]|nr:hypothetical protein [Thermoleophilaceae bacterium]
MVLLLAVDDYTPVRFVAGLCFFCLAPGAAILSLLTPNAQRFELGLVVGLSLSTLTLIATAMLAADAWDPEVATYAVAGVCLVVVLSKLVAARWRFSKVEPPDAPAEPRQRRGGRVDPGPRDPRPSGSHASPEASAATVALADPPSSIADLPAHAGASTTADARVTGVTGRRAISMCLLLAACGLWVVALRQTDLGDLSGYGLLTALPVTYYAALIALAAGFLVAVSERAPSQLLLAAHAVALIVLIHATTAVLYPEARYTYTYKHFGVIDYITKHGAVDRSIDIYQNWPGFFALNAWFQHASGVMASSYAAWAQVFFEAFNVLAILFVVRGLTQSVRLQWATVWLFLIADWVGQNYLAPQALAFPLVLLVAGLCIRCAPPPRGSQWRLGRRFRNWLGGTVAPGVSAVSRAGTPNGYLAPRQAAVVGAVLFGAIVVTHQLSPVVVILAVALFAIATARLPLRIVWAMAAIEAAWVASAWTYVSTHFTLVQLDLFLTSRPEGENAGRALPGVALVADSARFVVVAMVLFAVAGVVRQRRLRRLELAPVAFVLAPLVLVPFQPYGGEILFRTFLFALPWLAFFAAAASVPTLAGRTLLLPGRLAAATLIVGTAFLFAYFGLEKVNYVTRDDVAAVTWYDRHAPTGSAMAHAAPGFPDRIDANYARLRVENEDYIPKLSDMRVLRQRLARRRDVPAIAGFLRAAGARRTYLSITPSQESYSRLYGIMPRGALGRLVGLLRGSREFRLVYRRGRAFVFELQPTPTAGR